MELPLIESEPIEIPPPAFRPIRDYLDSVVTLAQLRHECANQGLSFGPETPWEQVTKVWGGVIPQGLHTILGGPGAGKSAFALQLAAECGCPCLFVTCEMTPEELLRRIAARVHRTAVGKFKNGDISGPEVRDLVSEALDSCTELYIANGMTEYISPEQIISLTEQIRKDNGHVLIVIDSFHAWVQSDPSPSSASEYDRLNAAVGQLLTIAANLKCPVIAVTEQNRASFGKHAPEEKLHAGAGTRKLEYSPETVLSLRRVNSDNEEQNGNKDTDMILTFEKNRNGAQGAKIPLIFQSEYMGFKEK
jgi:replicative DNA helicase